MNDWVAEQVAAAEALVGQTVASWAGVEMAVHSNAEESILACTSLSADESGNWLPPR